MADDSNLERCNMNWPKGLKDRVKAHAGARGLTEFTVTAVEVRLKDENRVETLETQVSELRFLVQLLADRYTIGGDHEDREAFLMEVQLPSWVSTEGWPENLARQVPKEHVELAVVPDEPAERTPSQPPAPVTGQDPDLHKPMFMTGPPKAGKSPMPADPAVLEAMGPVVFEGGGNDMFSRVAAKAAEKGIDMTGANLTTASKIAQPEPHNHAWLLETEMGEKACACGAYIEKPSADYPTGVVREGQDFTPTAVHENAEEFVKHLDTIAAPAENLDLTTTPITRALDDFEADF